ncbi:Protein SphX [wastewater metagenome]|uniref:Protein SphX n=2 Tax=unclassified sequences TaxID=12908 RepID=A0A5B8RAB3_9ZZZZ|nr:MULTISPECIES: PstS family phosphate ABC transporter substrate-binding protein [Arhodomonas]MCS4505751.1 PstS family phosphate ABC transporter substrate-binding protein [Arhodomonas aquaeolei]QEA04342.1 protein SphX [uncultured organism]
MQTWKKSAIAAAAVITLGAATGAQARDQIRIVGSSTVYPFASYVVEEFGATTDFPTPVIESTGSGGGLKLFCEGAGEDTPDITNASRRIKVSEFQRCQDNGVTEITETVVGYDGIVFAQSAGDEPINLTREQLLLATAAKVPQDGKLVDNPYNNWNQIDSSLPDREIVIYGPPTSSGTRDAFEELVMEAASEDIDAYGGGYTDIRQDGVYVPSGENDNLIVQKLAQNTDAFGIFGYSYLEENTDKIMGASIDGVEPKPEKISSGDYPVSRSLYFYIKNAHVGQVPGIQEYANLFMSKKMISRVGYLKDLGLIPLPQDVQDKYREVVKNLEPLKLSELK